MRKSHRFRGRGEMTGHRYSSINTRYIQDIFDYGPSNPVFRGRRLPYGYEKPSQVLMTYDLLWSRKTPPSSIAHHEAKAYIQFYNMTYTVFTNLSTSGPKLLIDNLLAGSKRRRGGWYRCSYSYLQGKSAEKESRKMFCSGRRTTQRMPRSKIWYHTQNEFSFDKLSTSTSW